MNEYLNTLAQFGKVAVLMGGNAAEREISLESGSAVHAALLRTGIDAHAIDWQGDLPLTQLEKFDRVFNAVHGRGGEDGKLQGALEIIDMPFTGSGVIGSAIAMDKNLSKQIWKGMGLPTPGFVAAAQEPNAEEIVADLGLPLMVKPAHEGSSFGASKVDKVEDLIPAWQAAHEFDDLVLIEQWITGGEYTVGILLDQESGRHQALPMIRLKTPREFYDYQAKYEEDTTEYLCPCGLDAQKEAQVQALALKAFAAVNCYGWGRVDVMLNEAGDPFLIEVNTVPGMTSHSLVPMAAKQQGVDFDELVLKILETSLR